ncbi:MAG: hypothetical protein H7288_16615 [Kineosporiaceae bacterium]|nr:hypothetical protein [Aeromicrobium sp.]
MGPDKQLKLPAIYGPGGWPDDQCVLAVIGLKGDDARNGRNRRYADTVSAAQLSTHLVEDRRVVA